MNQQLGTLHNTVNFKVILLTKLLTGYGTGTYCNYTMLSTTVCAEYLIMGPICNTALAHNSVKFNW